MIGQILKLIGLGAAVAALGACGVIDSIGGSKKVSPDEFKVVSHTPLTMPPNADLRPPRPGAPRPGDQTPQAQARAVLAPAAAGGRGGPARPSAASTGSPAETALLARAGAAGNGGSADIRTQLNRESRVLADNDRSFIDALIFWQDKPPPGVILDPVKEQARLRAATAQGTDPGGATPQIERRKRGIFEGIF